MRITTFWKLVDESRTAATEAKDHADTLVERLVAMEVKEIVAFARILNGCWCALSLQHVWYAVTCSVRGTPPTTGSRISAAT